MIVLLDDLLCFFASTFEFGDELTFLEFVDSDIEAGSGEVGCSDLETVSESRSDEAEELTINAEITRRVPKTASIR